MSPGSAPIRTVRGPSTIAPIAGDNVGVTRLMSATLGTFINGRTPPVLATPDGVLTPTEPLSKQEVRAVNRIVEDRGPDGATLEPPAVSKHIPRRVAERAATRYEVDPETGCHVSTYSVGSHGYSQIGWHTGAVRTATTGHRAAWVYWTRQQIVDGLTVDHACRNRRCVNFDHLRLMSNRQNATDNGWHAGTRYVGEPEDTGRLCPHGHVVWAYPSGSQVCRECPAAKRRRSR